MFCFFFNDTATTEIYTLSLHDALPIYGPDPGVARTRHPKKCAVGDRRSEEHTSELQSHHDLVCRLLLEKKKTKRNPVAHNNTATVTTDFSSARYSLALITPSRVHPAFSSERCSAAFSVFFFF